MDMIIGPTGSPIDEAGRPIAVTPQMVQEIRHADRQERRKRARWMKKHEHEQLYGKTVRVLDNRGQPGVEYHPPQEASGVRAAAARPWDTSHLMVEPSKLSRETRLLCAGFGPPAQGTEPHLLACRVDWLTCAFKVELRPKLLQELEERLDVDGQERVAVVIADLSFELKRMRTGKRMLARNADVAIVLDPDGPDGWNVQIDFTGGYLMRSTVDRAVQLARELVASLGPNHGERVRRLDLCADIGRWDIGEIKGENFVKPSRARLERATLAQVEKPMENPLMRQYRRGGIVTGFTVCPGNILSAVIYNKREELGLHPEKRDAEEERWKEGGWDGESPVTRVEFRLRSEALHELNSRDGLDAFRLHLDELWHYCCNDWLRIVLPQPGARLGRCPIDPTWRAVRGVQFHHEPIPMPRFRLRGGASAAQTFGAVLSTLARDGLSPPLRDAINEETGEVLTEPQQVAQLDDDGARELVRERVAGLFRVAGKVIADDILARRGVRPAALFVLYREAAARARFSSTELTPVERLLRAA